MIYDCCPKNKYDKFGPCVCFRFCEPSEFLEHYFAYSILGRAIKFSRHNKRLERQEFSFRSEPPSLLLLYCAIISMNVFGVLIAEFEKDIHSI